MHLQVTRRPVPNRELFDAGLFEPLEARSLLSGGGTPLPDLAGFEDPTNPALRLTTRFGEIDIELFAHQLPGLVASFLEGLERGLTSDQTFFHRLIPGRVLQGGLFAYQPGRGIGAVPANLAVEDPVGIGRPNTERTIAVGSLLDGGFLTTSQLIINLDDNTEHFDPAQAVVFARVVDDRSWAVVQTMAALPVADLTMESSFVGLWAGSFHNVPVTGDYQPPSEDGDPGTPITNELLTTTYDLAVIKAPGADDFYRHVSYEPEGFLHAGIREFIPIENPHDEPVYYEINARFEAGPSGTIFFRDDLVTRGVIAPHSRGGVTLTLGGNGIDGAVRSQNEPFALELRSTRALYATLSHYDFGSTIAMPFTERLDTVWHFPRAEKLGDVHDFLVWANPGSENAEVRVILIAEDGTELDPIVFQADRFRRGGINLGTHEGVPEGVFSVRLESTQPVVVSRSHYADSGEPRFRPEGYGEAGARGVPSSVGVLAIAGDPGAAAPDGLPTLTLHFFNPGPSDAVIDIELYRPDETEPVRVIPGALSVAPGRAGSMSLVVEEASSLVYRACTGVHASYELRRTEGSYGGAVPVLGATEHHFADGFNDPGRAAPNELEETLHLFSPDADAEVTITFRFTDGHELTLTRSVAAGALARVEVSQLEEVIAQAIEHGRFFYSCAVVSDVPLVAQMLHVDARLGSGQLRGGGFIVSGTLAGDVRRLDEPQ